MWTSTGARSSPAEMLYAPEALVYHKLSATGGGPVASYYTGETPCG